jgi:hypothetical protein
MEASPVQLVIPQLAAVVVDRRIAHSQGALAALEEEEAAAGVLVLEGRERPDRATMVQPVLTEPQLKIAEVAVVALAVAGAPGEATSAGQAAWVLIAAANWAPQWERLAGLVVVAVAVREPLAVPAVPVVVAPVQGRRQQARPIPAAAAAVTLAPPPGREQQGARELSLSAM